MSDPVNALRRAPRLKIGVVVPKYGLVGGGERFASEVTERLARNEDFEIHVFANRWVAASPRVTFHWVPIVRFPRFLGPWVFSWVARWKARRAGVQVLHTHHWIEGADLYSAHGVPHAGWVKDVRRKAPSLYDRAVIALERRLIERGARATFLPVSSVAMNEFRRQYAALPGRWEVQHPGVDAQRFATPDRAACRADIRARYGIGADDVLLLFVGMNFEVKGLDTILESLAQARAARPDAAIRLLVVGRGNQAKYGAKAKALGIGDAVVFAGAQHQSIERFYRAADAFVLFSDFDTFGMVVLEAMAASLPVIVSPNVGASDLVAEGVNGYVLPNPRDAAAGADRIVQLLDATRRVAMGAAAQREAERHSWENLVGRIEGRYRELAAQRGVS